MRRHHYVTRCECFDSSNFVNREKGIWGNEHDVLKCGSWQKKKIKQKKNKKKQKQNKTKNQNQNKN